MPYQPYRGEWATRPGNEPDNKKAADPMDPPPQSKPKLSVKLT
jgi:hypothetical protein